MKYWLFALSAILLSSCDMSTEKSCTQYTSALSLAQVEGGEWQSGTVLTVQFEGQTWLDTLHFIPRSKDTLAFIERKCPGFSIRNRLVQDTLVTWQVDSLVSHPEWGQCTSMGHISLPTSAEDIRLILSPSWVALKYSWESCSSGDEDDDDDDWDD